MEAQPVNKKERIAAAGRRIERLVFADWGDGDGDGDGKEEEEEKKNPCVRMVIED